MRPIRLAGAVLACALCGATATHAQQTIGQDMKDAGHATANAGRTVGHDTAKDTHTVVRKTKNGSREGYHKTATGTKTAYHRTANATSNAGRTIAGKPARPTPPTKPQE